MTSDQFTEQSTSNTVVVDSMSVHYHDVGSGYPLVMLHSYGPGTTGWITFHKVLPALAEHFRCIVMDLPNFGRTGPLVYEEPLHNLHARTSLGLMDALGIEKAHLLGNSQDGQSAMVLAMKAPQRVNRLVFGACHIRTGGDLYLMANRPSEGSRATREVLAEGPNATRDTVRRYLQVHIDDPDLVTDDLVDYIHGSFTGHPDHIEANRKSVSVPYDHGGGPAKHYRPKPHHPGPLRPHVRLRNRHRCPSTTWTTPAWSSSTTAATGSPSKSPGSTRPTS